MPRKSTLTPQEIRKALDEPFEIWQACKCSYCELRDFKRGPTPDQRKVFEIPHKHAYDIVCAYGGRRGAKCFRRGTNVIKFDGTLVKVEDVQIGDQLMGPDSKPRTVLDLAQGREMMYKIQPTKGEAFYCNESHILALKLRCPSSVMGPRFKGEPPRTTKRYKQGYINVSVKDYLNWPKHKKNAYVLYQSDAIEFQNLQTLEIDPYMFGVWLGDGSSEGFNITTMDPEIVSKTYQLADAWNLTVKVQSKSGANRAKTYRITGTPGGSPEHKSKSLTGTLSRMGVLNSKHIPHNYLTASREDRLQLLAGLLDSDGHNHENKYLTITQKNRVLANNIAFLARSLGFSVFDREIKASCMVRGEKFTGTYRKLSICGDLHLIPTLLPRKQMPDKGKKYFNQKHRSFKIEKLEEDDYFGFSVDGDNLFLLKDFLVAHNSQSAIAKGIDYALRYPGCTILVGAESLELLKRTALKYWRERFTIRTPWDHPYVARAPGDHNKCLELINGSQIWFLYFSEFEILRGLGITFAHIEEGSHLENADSMYELARSLSEILAPQNQLIITTNPEESKGWIHETFEMKQFQPGYKGEPIPIGKPCTCQFCPTCIAEDEEPQVEFVDGLDPKGRPAKICPRCPTKLTEDDAGKPVPRFTMKTNPCPGNQYYMRVVFFDPSRNPHIMSGYREMSKQLTSKEDFDLYTKGLVVERRSGKAYFHYSDENINSHNYELDYSKDLVWSFDFNKRRQCSVICQERESPDGVDIDVIKEIVIPPVPGYLNVDNHLKIGPSVIAKQFLWLYPKFDKYVHFYGDPSALNAKAGDNDLSEYQVIASIISDPLKRNKHGELVYLTEEEAEEFIKMGGVPKKVKTMPTKIKGQTKIGVTLKVDSLNMKLRDSAERMWIHINPQNEWLLKSLEDMKWKEKAGRQMLDCQCDATDAKNPNKSKVRLVSHITDALAYYVAKKWPVYRKPEGLYAVVPGEMAVAVTDTGEVLEAPDHDEDEDREKTHKEKMEQLKAELADIEVQKGSLLEVFHSREVFESGGTLMDFFGAGF